MKQPLWPAQKIGILRAEYADTPTAELAKRFGLRVTQVYAKAALLGLKKSAAYLSSPAAGRILKGGNSGACGRFRRGSTPWNKGMKGLKLGGKETQFRPGQSPHNTCAIGDYRITRDGTLQRKISNVTGNNSRRWRSVHELVWIEAHGPVPKKHIVVFKKGMKTTELEAITLDKIECISLAENMRRNTFHNYGKEIAHLYQLRGAITRQINRRSNPNA